MSRVIESVFCIVVPPENWPNAINFGVAAPWLNNVHYFLSPEFDAPVHPSKAESTTEG